MSDAPIFDRVCRDHGFAHIDRPLGTVTTPRVVKLPDLTVVTYTGHGINHGTYRPDVRVLPLAGPQSPGGASC